MLDKMKQLMEFKRQADQIKKELDAMTVEVNEVHGIRLAISGSQEFRSVEIDAAMMAPGHKADLERDLMRSLNAAVKKSQQEAARRMAKVMPGMGM